MENEKEHETTQVAPTCDSVNKKVDDDFVSSGESFDIFVSYASKMRAQANSAVEILQHLRPGIKYFVDVNELHAGARWQQTLYDALDNTRLVLFILTPAFLKSIFCHEEAAIAALRGMEGRGDVIAVEAIPTDPAQQSHLPRAVANSIVRNESLYDACRRALKRLDNPRQVNDDVATRTFETRRLLHKSKMTSLYEVNEERKNGSQRPGGHVGSPRLCIVGHPSNQASMTRIQRKIESRVPTKYSVRILLPKEHDMSFIDSATIMICVLSKDFLRSEFCMNALNIGILRNRTDGGYLIPIAIEHLDPLSTPSFIRLLPTVDASSWINCDNEKEENFVIQELIVAAAEMSWEQQWKDHTTLIDV